MKLVLLRSAQSLVAIYILGFSVAISYVAADLFIEPVTIIDLTIPEPNVRAGSTLTIHVEYERRKICKSEIDRFLVTRLFNKSYRVVFRQQTPGLLIMGHDNVDLTLAIPPEIPPGNYDYVQYLISYCPLITRVDSYPVRQVVVLPPSAP